MDFVQLFRKIGHCALAKVGTALVWKLVKYRNLFASLPYIRIVFLFLASYDIVQCTGVLEKKYSRISAGSEDRQIRQKPRSRPFSAPYNGDFLWILLFIYCLKYINQWGKCFLKLQLNTYRMLPFQRSQEKKPFFFCFHCATQNKALDMIKWVSKIFFHWRIYGVNSKRIDNGLDGMTIPTIVAEEFLKKIWK